MNPIERSARDDPDLTAPGAEAGPLHEEPLRSAVGRTASARPAIRQGRLEEICSGKSSIRAPASGPVEHGRLMKFEMPRLGIYRLTAEEDVSPPKNRWTATLLGSKTTGSSPLVSSRRPPGSFRGEAV